MLNKFLESSGEGLSKQWMQYLLGPAFLFWGGGLIIIALQTNLKEVWDTIKELDASTQIAGLIIGLFIVVLSSRLMQELRFAFLRFLEGYWGPLSFFTLPSRRLHQYLIQKSRDRWDELMDTKDKGILSPSEKQELARLETNGHYDPANLNECMPTTLGNVLHNAETIPLNKYGLDAVICWPSLWLLLSKDVQETLSSARQKLDEMVELWGWGFFFMIWAFWSPWAILISLVWMAIAYSLAIQVARTYSDLIEASFDLYRWSLYEAVRWVPPAVSGAEERATGEQLCEFLWRGTSEYPIRYVKKEKTKVF